MGAGGDMGVGVGELSGGWDYDKEGERMDKQQDGGPAFPVSYGPDGAAGFSGGMTLRDWFAGQALAGVLANPAEGSWGTNEAPNAATNAYQMADAMLARRAKEPT